MHDAPIITEADILSEVIAFSAGDLAPEVAKSLLKWKFTHRAVSRMNRLAERNRRGAITDIEREELERYLRVGSLVNLVQARARLSLRRASKSS